MKRPFFHRLFSALLALLVLTASVGMAVQQHTCRQSGNRTTAVVFSTPQHRCPVLEPTPEALYHSTKAQPLSSCCDFQAHLHKLDAPAPELTWAKLLPPSLTTHWLPPVVADWLIAPLVARATTWYASDSSPPSRTGRQLLTFIQVLVV